jgi:predicted GIY-YIG superfamily endonuclease
MVHWVYVLECEDDRIYIGETIKLYTRWSRHINGTGAKCTQYYQPENIIGLYNISKNIAFENYKNDNDYKKLLANFNIDWEDMDENEFNNLDIENYITECFMKNFGQQWWKVRGGKYTKLIGTDFDYTSPVYCDCVNKMGHSLIEKPMCKSSNCKNPILNKNISDRPNCLCGYPCEINMYNNELYYNCALKNANNWVKFDDLGLYQNCNFYQKYKVTIDNRLL